MTALLPRRGEASMNQSTTMDTQLAKAFSHPLRQRILSALDSKVNSPNRLSADLAESLGNVSYHVRVLLDNGCIKLVKQEPRRGAVEHYYTATERGRAAVAPPLRLNNTQRELLAKMLDHFLDGNFEDLHFSKTGNKIVREIRDEVAV